MFERLNYVTREWQAWELVIICEQNDIKADLYFINRKLEDDNIINTNNLILKNYLLKACPAKQLNVSAKMLIYFTWTYIKYLISLHDFLINGLKQFEAGMCWYFLCLNCKFKGKLLITQSITEPFYVNEISEYFYQQPQHEHCCSLSLYKQTHGQFLLFNYCY